MLSWFQELFKFLIYQLGCSNVLMSRQLAWEMESISIRDNASATKFEFRNMLYVRRELGDKIQVSKLTTFVSFLLKGINERFLISVNHKLSSFQHVPKPFDHCVYGQEFSVVSRPVLLGCR
ncbi:hypothetical protein TNCV_3623391 [Trichonephila clavipes]|nr:hypothetical protein TNCV_3623391 [Trichonephila clavipes]